MSVPTTPAEMADWLEGMLAEDEIRTPWRDDELTIASHVIETLRRQPSDAQKIETLHAMSEATEWAEDVRHAQDPYYGEDLTEEERYFVRLGSSKAAEIAWHEARKALRLLGLPTDNDAP